MQHSLVKICLCCLLTFCVSLLSVFCFSFSARASSLENQSYFIKQIQKDRVLVVSPNFKGELTQASLLPSLSEISKNYHIRATRAIEAEKLNGKLVPGLIVYVENRPMNIDSSSVVATKP